MSYKRSPSVKKRKRFNRGQAISEYAMLLAFIAILVALVFAFAPGQLAPAVSSAFSRMSEELNKMNQAAANTSSFITIIDMNLLSR